MESGALESAPDFFASIMAGLPPPRGCGSHDPTIKSGFGN